MEKIEIIHPGEILLTEFMEPNGISQAKLADGLALPQSQILEIIEGKQIITGDIALRLSGYFGNSSKFWLNLQNNFDIERSAYRNRSRRQERRSYQAIDIV